MPDQDAERRFFPNTRNQQRLSLIAAIACVSVACSKPRTAERTGVEAGGPAPEVVQAAGIGVAGPGQRTAPRRASALAAREACEALLGSSDEKTYKAELETFDRACVASKPGACGTLAAMYLSRRGIEP